MFDLKKSRGVSDTKFEEKLTWKIGLENDMRNLANFHQTMFGSLKLSCSEV